MLVGDFLGLIFIFFLLMWLFDNVPFLKRRLRVLRRRKSTHTGDGMSDQARRSSKETMQY